MAELRFSFSAGALIRGHIRREIKSYCFIRGYRLSIDEDKGLISSLFNVTIYLPDTQFETTHEELFEWLNKIQNR